MQYRRTRSVGAFAIVLGVLLASTAFADESTVTGGNGAAAAAQVHFQITIPEEVSAVFQDGGETTPFVYSNAGSVTYTVVDYRASTYEIQSQLATIAVP